MIGAAILMAVGLSAAQPVQDWRPFETREDAWRRQQSQDFQHRQANPMGVNPRTEPLGSSRVPPPSSFNSMGQPQWNSTGQRPAEPWRR